jgi:putative SOS response-associated peptidase YedK
MCGRITLTRPNLESIAAELEVADARGYPLYQPHYNIAPSHQNPILVLQEFEGHRSRQISPMYWGFVNDRPGAGAPAMQINARCETLESRPRWRDALGKSRCAVITDGFFEWTGPKSARRPLWFHRPDHGLILMAGLWEWHRAQDGFMQTFAIITTAANATMAPVHERMPVILDPSAVTEWIDDRTGAGRIRNLLTPAPDDLLVAQAVSPLVNNVANDSADLLRP